MRRLVLGCSPTPPGCCCCCAPAHALGRSSSHTMFLACATPLSVREPGASTIMLPLLLARPTATYSCPCVKAEQLKSSPSQLIVCPVHSTQFGLHYNSASTKRPTLAFVDGHGVRGPEWQLQTHHCESIALAIKPKANPRDEVALFFAMERLHHHHACVCTTKLG